MLEQASNPETQKQLIEMKTRNSELIAAVQREQDLRKLLEQEAAKLKTAEKQGQSLPVFFAVSLNPGLLRDISSVQKFSAPPGANLVQLGLNLAPENYRRYRATLQRVGGEEIWTQISPAPKSIAQNQLQLILPAKLLTPGDYVLKLSGMTASGNFEDAGMYYFRMTQK